MKRRGLSLAPKSEPKRPKVLLSDLKIRTKEKTVVTLEPNPVQVKYLDDLTPGWRDGHYDLRGIREDILKARQFGFTTLIEALFFLDTINNPNTATVVIAHDLDSTRKIFSMVRRFYDLLPPEKKPPTRYSNRKELDWEGINSSFIVATAGSGSAGRGGTINNVHASEVAFWPNADEILTGLFEAVPIDGNVFLESTANGLGNYYHSEYVLAQAGDSVYTPRFYAWFEHPEYRLPLDGPLQPNPEPEEQEREDALRANHGVDDEQIAWRRWKKKALRAKFEQEYPSNPREAFLTSGKKYFDAAALARISEEVETVVPIASPPLPADGLLAKNGGLQVFALPVEGRQYVIAADTAEGLDEDGKNDYDSAHVFDADTWEEVAHLHGLWDTHTYGLMLAELGRWYNTALLGIERNNHGHAVINAAMHTAEYPIMEPGVWSGLYMFEDYDEQKPVAVRKAGWPTNVRTKYFALAGLATSILERAIKIRSKGTAAELLTFLMLPGGKAGAEKGSHDDRVMSLSIADALLKMRPPQAAYVYALPDDHPADSDGYLYQ